MCRCMSNFLELSLLLHIRLCVCCLCTVRVLFVYGACVVCVRCVCCSCTVRVLFAYGACVSDTIAPILDYTCYSCTGDICNLLVGD